MILRTYKYIRKQGRCSGLGCCRQAAWRLDIQFSGNIDGTNTPARISRRLCELHMRAYGNLMHYKGTDILNATKSAFDPAAPVTRQKDDTNIFSMD